MFTVPETIGALRIFLLYLGAVEQDQFCDFNSGPCCMYGSPETLLHQQRQIAYVVQVTVCEDYCIKGRYIKRQGLPVELT